MQREEVAIFSLCEVMLVCRSPVIEKHRQNGKFLYMCLPTTGTNNLGLQGLPVKLE